MGKIFHTMLGTCAEFDNMKLGILATWISRQGKTHFVLKNKKISTVFEVP